MTSIKLLVLALWLLAFIASLFVLATEVWQGSGYCPNRKHQPLPPVTHKEP